MKFEPNKRYTKIAIYAFIVLAAAILFYYGVNNMPDLTGFLSWFLGLLTPLIFALVIAYLLNPILRLFDDRFMPWLSSRLSKSKKPLKRKTNRVLSLLLTYIVALLLILTFVLLIVPQLVDSLTLLLRDAPSYIETAQGMFTDFMGQIALNAEAETFVGNAMATVLESITGYIEQISKYLIDLIPSIFSMGARFTIGVVNLLIGFVLSVYLLYDREKIFAKLKKIVFAIFPERLATTLHGIALDSHRIFSGFITGRVIDSAIIGVLCFIGMSILRMPYTMLISVVVGVTNVIPYVGPFIGAIPSGFIILIESPIMCLWFAIFILILQQFDGNVLGPKIMGNTLGVSPIWIIVGLLVFGGILGPVGMFIGVPLIVVCNNLVSRFINFLLKRKGKPTDIDDYASDKNPLL